MVMYEISITPTEHNRFVRSMRHVIRSVNVRRLGAIVIVLCIGFVALPKANGVEVSSHEGHAFPADAILAWKKYIAAIDNLQGTMTNEAFDIDPLTGQETPSYVIRRKIKLHQDFGIVQHTDRYFTKANNTPATQVRGNNGRYHFQLTKSNKIPDSPWVIRSVGGNEEKLTPDRDPAQLAKWATLFGLRSTGKHLLSEMVVEPVFKVLEVSEFQENGQDLVNVTFSYETADNSNRPVTGGTMTFNPNRYWLQERAALTATWGNPDTGYKGTIDITWEYVDGVLPVPLPKKMTVHHVGKPINPRSDEADLDQGQIFTFQWESLPQFDEKDFTLSAYGLPEPDLRQIKPWASPSRTLIYLICGNVLLAIAFFIWYLRRRQSRQK